MKRVLSIILCMCFIFAFCVAVSAANEYDEGLYRLTDYTETLSEKEYKEINAVIDELIPELKIDLPIYIFSSLDDGETLYDRAKLFYEYNGFGYGDNKSGVILAVSFKAGIFGVYRFGDAQTLLTDEQINSISDMFSSDYSNNVSFADLFKKYTDNIADCLKTQTTSYNYNRTDGMPYWYYEGDISSFKDFHGTNLRRVVDDADIFTDEQEEYLNKRMNEVVEKYGIGYALLTDNDNHGLSPEEYSSDFLHFGGYGVGDEYGAVVFYLCFDPSDRCWRTTSINSYEQIFTEDITYEIDETVDADIRAGRYYEAFIKHIDFVENLFMNYSVNIPDWYPENTNTLTLDRSSREYAKTASLSKPRVIDNAGIFTDEMIGDAQEKLNELSRQYGYDLIIFTDKEYHTYYRSDYAEDFYYYNGYGKDGIVFYIFTDNFDHGTVYYGTVSFGECYKKYGELDLKGEAYNGIHKRDVKKAIHDYTDSLEFALKKGRLPMSLKSILICLAISVIAGLITGGVHITKCKKGMKITYPVDARNYLVNGSFSLRNKKVDYLYSTVTRVAKPKSSSSSSGGSSYSSGSSSGGSYSSGGRSF